MKKNLKNKIALIIAVLLVCLYGIFGIPSGVSGKALLDAMTSRIHLGLDLHGGAHLILQVVVSEAVNAETDNTVGRIQQDLKTANLTFSQVYKPDPTKPKLIRSGGHAAGQCRAPCARCSTPSTPTSTTCRRRLGHQLHADHEAAGARRLSKRRPSSRRSRPFATAWTRSASASR